MEKLLENVNLASKPVLVGNSDNRILLRCAVYCLSSIIAKVNPLSGTMDSFHFS